MAQTEVRGATSLIGGGEGAIDKIPTAALGNGDATMAIVPVTTTTTTCTTSSTTSSTV